MATVPLLAGKVRDPAEARARDLAHARHVGVRIFAHDAAGPIGDQRPLAAEVVHTARQGRAGAESALVRCRRGWPRLPYLDELVIVDVPDQNAAHLKFEAGEVDALPNAIPENFERYTQHQREGRFTLYDVGPGLSITFFWFNLNRVRQVAPGKPAGSPQVDPIKFGWFSNAVFRRAVSMAIDRDAMIKSVFYGDAVKNWSSATPGNKNWYMPDVVHDDYDPAEAKRLLAGLGWSDRDGDGTIEDTGGHPVAFTLKTNSNNSLRVAMANFIRDDLAKIGIRVTSSVVDFNTLITSVNRDYQYDAVILGLVPTVRIRQARLSGCRAAA